jgi:hypothetical protein
METGKKSEVLIEDCYQIDERTGMKQLTGYISVWADVELKKVIASIPGVTNVYDITCRTKYDVFLDPRYDREIVKQNIENAILINSLGNEF